VIHVALWLKVSFGAFSGLGKTLTILAGFLEEPEAFSFNY